MFLRFSFRKTSLLLAAFSQCSGAQRLLNDWANVFFRMQWWCVSPTLIHTVQLMTIDKQSACGMLVVCSWIWGVEVQSLVKYAENKDDKKHLFGVIALHFRSWILYLWICFWFRSKTIVVNSLVWLMTKKQDHLKKYSFIRHNGWCWHGSHVGPVSSSTG